MEINGKLMEEANEAHEYITTRDKVAEPVSVEVWLKAWMARFIHNILAEKRARE